MTVHEVSMGLQKYLEPWEVSPLQWQILRQGYEHHRCSKWWWRGRKGATKDGKIGEKRRDSGGWSDGGGGSRGPESGEYLEKKEQQ